MDERVIVYCNGLFIKKINGRYREVTSLEFLSAKTTGIDETKTLNPIMIEDMIPQSLPGEAIKIVEQKLPRNLLDIRKCFETVLQDNLQPFIYKGEHYLFMGNTLTVVITESEV